MSTFRLPLTLLALALLSACHSKHYGFVAGGTGMDSPILVSDDLHIRHAHFMGGGKADFQIQPNGQVTAFDESGNEIKSIKCENMTLVNTSGTYPDCTHAGSDVSGGKQWQIDIYASMNGSGPSLVTLKPTSSSLCANGALCQVTITSNNGNVLYSTQDDGSDNDTQGGTDIAAYDTTGNTPLSFGSATLTVSSYSNPATMTCNSTGNHACKIRIKYH